MIETKVGIEFTRIGAPQISKVIEGAAEKAVEQLEKVDEKAAEYFMESARKLIEEKGEVKALALALAQITGYTSPVSEKSLLGGLPGYTTVRIFTKATIRSPGYVINMLRPYTESVKEIRTIAGGAVFDVPTEVANQLVELKKGYESYEICKELPEELNSLEDNFRKFSSSNSSYGGQRKPYYGGGGRSYGGGSSYGGNSNGSSDRYSGGHDDRGSYKRY